MVPTQFLPPTRHPHKVVATIGLISDTHFPLRCEVLPMKLFTIFEGIDLLLHAGDVGELEVLDQLSRIAPVVAVHGNDEASVAESTLPYQQVLTVAGRRILLWHSHYPDRQEELASRVDDAMVPKFQRTITRAQAAGATIAVFGHWHIPLLYEQDGVTVINPGAIASGNFFSRQLLQSVALLFLLDDGTHDLVYIDLASGQPFAPLSMWPASFKESLDRYSDAIFEPEAEELLRQIQPHLSEALRHALIQYLLPLIQRCWRHELTMITLPMVQANLNETHSLPPHLYKELQTVLRKGQNGISL